MTPRKMVTPQSQSSLWEKSEPQTVPSSIIFFLILFNYKELQLWYKEPATCFSAAL